MKHPYPFLLGFALGYLPVLYLLAHTFTSEPTYPADTEDGSITVVLETITPGETESSDVLAAQDSLPSSTPTSSPSPTVEPTLTPTPVPPTPVATPDVWPPEIYRPWLEQYAGQYGIDSNILERIAQCESQFNPTIVSPNGKYAGLFQFSEKTWQTYRGPEHLNLDTNPQLRTNPEEAIRTAAYVVQQRGTAPWPACI